MYLLLAIGISIAVLMISGALLGFIAGFVDGFNDKAPNDDAIWQSNIVYYTVAFAFLLIGMLLHLVFLGLGFSSYTLGRIPQGGRLKVILLMMVIMAGIAVIYTIVYNPLSEPANAVFGEPDKDSRSIFIWMNQHLWYSIPLFSFVEVTIDMVLFGAILRELLEWKHRPLLVIGALLLIMSIVYCFSENNIWVILLSMLMLVIDAWTYECTRSIIPLIVGDSFFWVVALLLMGSTISLWFILPVAAIIIPAVYCLVRTMDPYKPID